MGLKKNNEDFKNKAKHCGHSFCSSAASLSGHKWKNTHLKNCATGCNFPTTPTNAAVVQRSASAALRQQKSAGEHPPPSTRPRLPACLPTADSVAIFCHEHKQQRRVAPVLRSLRRSRSPQSGRRVAADEPVVRSGDEGGAAPLSRRVKPG